MRAMTFPIVALLGVVLLSAASTVLAAPATRPSDPGDRVRPFILRWESAHPARGNDPDFYYPRFEATARLMDYLLRCPKEGAALIHSRESSATEMAVDFVMENDEWDLLVDSISPRLYPTFHIGAALAPHAAELTDAQFERCVRLIPPALEAILYPAQDNGELNVTIHLVRSNLRMLLSQAVHRLDASQRDRADLQAAKRLLARDENEFQEPAEGTRPSSTSQS